MKYFLMPFLAWLVTGIVKFIINCAREKRLAFDLVGYGGMPSNHSAIVTSTATLIGLGQGWHTPEFGIAVTVAFIVILDATSLRQKIAQHAIAINRINADTNVKLLRERVGHTKVEVLVGCVLGAACAVALYNF